MWFVLESPREGCRPQDLGPGEPGFQSLLRQVQLCETSIVCPTCFALGLFGRKQTAMNKYLPSLASSCRSSEV